MKLLWQVEQVVVRNIKAGDVLGESGLRNFNNASVLLDIVLKTILQIFALILFTDNQLQMQIKYN